MKLVDTHAHLYAEEFEEDRAEMLQRAMDKGVDKFYLPNIDSRSISAMIALEKQYPRHCHAMMGLHPCYVKENYQEELNIVKEWLDDRRFCAVGEIGMDLYWDKSFLKEQEQAFVIQSEWAMDLGLPIVIHSREATDRLIELIREMNDPRLRGIFHCFTGNSEQAEKIIDLGLYLGIGGVLTFKNAGLDKTVKEIDIRHLVLETDAPYLAPKPFRGKRNESSYLLYIAQKLAEIKGVTVEEVAAVTTQNAENIFEFQTERTAQ